MRRVTSTRGRPSSSRGMGSRPVTRPDSSAHTGRTPRRASASATSSPWVRMAAVPHSDQADRAGPVARLVPVAVDSASARPGPTSQASGGGQGLGVDGVEVAAGGQHVGHAPGGRAAGPGGHVAAVEGGEQVADLVGGPAPGAARDLAGTPSVRYVRRSVAGGCGTHPGPAGGRGPRRRRRRPRRRRRRRRDGPPVDAHGGRHGGPQRRDAALGQAGDGQHAGRARPRPRAAGRGCGARPGSGRPSARTGSRRRGGAGRRSRRPRGRRLAPRSRCELGPLDQQVPELGPEGRQLGRVEGRDLGVLVRAGARAGPGRRRCRPGSWAAAGGRRPRRGPGAWPGCPRPGR